MNNAEMIVDAVTMAGVIAMLVCPVLAIALYATGGVAWRQAKRRFHAEEKIHSLERRLHDLEHLRGMDAARLIRDPKCMKAPDGWRCTRAPGHDGSCAAVPDSGKGSFADPDAPEIVRGERVDDDTGRIVSAHLGEMA